MPKATRLEGYLVAYTNRLEKTGHDTFFDYHTDFMLNRFPIMGVKVDWDHKKDSILSDFLIGSIDTVEQRHDGIFVRAFNHFAFYFACYLAGKPLTRAEKAAQIARAVEYQSAIDAMARRSMLGWSCGLDTKLYREGAGGHVDVCPITSAAITPSPAFRLRTIIGVT